MIMRPEEILNYKMQFSPKLCTQLMCGQKKITILLILHNECVAMIKSNYRNDRLYYCVLSRFKI